MLFKLSYLSSNFALTLGYLNLASNNQALIGNQANHDAYSTSGAQVGAKNKDFSVVSQTELTRSLVPFVVQVANCCLRSSF